MSYSIPPVPPLNGFDVRFKGDWRYSESGGEIFIQNEHWPLKVEIRNQISELANSKELSAGHWVLVDGTSGNEFILDEYEIVELVEPTNKLTLYRNTLTPEHFALHQNYPNPFNPVTNIRFDLPDLSYVHLAIFNLLGQEVSVLADGKMAGGSHTVIWDGSKYSSGIYICKLSSREVLGTDFGHLTNKMVLLK